MLQYFRTNLKYRIIAIVLALGIWFFVFERQNPTEENVLSVPLEVNGLDQGLVIADKPYSVNVRFEGKKSIVSNVTTRDIEAYVNMTTAHIGVNSLPVYVDLPQGVSLVGVEPTYVKITVDAVTSIQLPVEVNISGSAAPGFKLGTPQLAPDQVIILGPRNVLENIDRAFIDVRLSGLSEDYVKNLPVKLADENGNLIYNDWLTTKPDSVEIFLPVIKDAPVRKLPVTYKLIGKPAKGYEIKSVSIYPEVVEISAVTESVLYSINYLQVEVPVKGSKETLDLEVPLQVPEGITVVGEKTVKVIVEIGPQEEKE